MKRVLKKLQEGERGILYACIIYLVLVLADVVSTLLSWNLLEHLEANPLYKYGGLLPIVLLNFLVIWLIYYRYSKTENIDMRFYFLLMLVCIITTRCLVVYQNIQIAMNPPTLAQIQAIGEQAMAQLKRNQLYELMLINMMPFINGAFAWLLFKRDHEVKIWKKQK